ncbi:MAG: XRE family transcriptional regulator [Treponema sp.]|jgi:transcriptional regulator with XRE-family HTH domain|nr:XRE family transcriptional regulator [Treponema sp.]
MAAQKGRIGLHIRKLRRFQELTLQNVADKCGFTKSLLSKIEGGKIVPAMSTLVKIAGALNTNIAALMAEGDNVDSVFIPAHQKIKPFPTESGYAVLPLAVEFTQKKMQPFIFTVRPEDLKDKVNSHLGEEFIFVLEGAMEFRVGDQVYIMRSRDSIFFNSVQDHYISKVLSDQVVYLDIFN